MAITINGNEEVGIGQPTPFRKLHVNSGTTNVVARFESTDTTAAIEFKDNNGSAEVGNIGDNVVFFPAGAEKMRITSAGNVGIGVTTTDAKLQIDKANANSSVIISRSGTNIGVSTGVGSITFPSHYNSSYTDYAAIQAYSNALSAVRGSLDLKVKSTSGNLLTGLTVYGTSSGVNVGIGTVSPEAKLDVEAGDTGGAQGDSTTAAIFRAGRQNVWFQNQRTAAGTDWNNNTFKIIAKVDTTSHQSINFVNDASYNEHIDIYTGNQVFNTRFNANGNVGIGNTNPLAKLQITSGDSGASSPWSNADELVLESSGNAGLAFQTPNTGAATIAFQDPESVQAGFIQYLHADNALRFATNGNNERMRIESTGVVKFPNTATSTGDVGTIAHYTNNYMYIRGGTGGLAIGDDGFDTSIYLNNSDSIQFQTGGTERMRITSTGNVGIGVTGPTTKLDVGGSVRIAAGSNLYFTSSNTTFKIQQDTTNSELDIYGGALVPAISIDNSSHLALPGYGLSGSGTPIKLLGLDSSSNVVTATSFNLILDDTPAASTDKWKR